MLNKLFMTFAFLIIFCSFIGCGNEQEKTVKINLSTIDYLKIYDQLTGIEWNLENDIDTNQNNAVLWAKSNRNLAKIKSKLDESQVLEDKKELNEMLKNSTSALQGYYVSYKLLKENNDSSNLELVRKQYKTNIKKAMSELGRFDKVFKLKNILSIMKNKKAIPNTIHSAKLDKNKLTIKLFNDSKKEQNLIKFSCITIWEQLQKEKELPKKIVFVGMKNEIIK
ncbi:hypothetical protein AAEX28_12355 [Lentisphaerota bacterium WC36G]|nr:hypothetical protein LJT99_15185 [Lentisphaerae bacterium WC36]